MCSLNWQHQLCKNPRPNPDIKTLFTDHTCSPPNGARTSPVSVPLAAVPKAGAAYQPLTGHAVCTLYNIISCLCAFYDPYSLLTSSMFINAAIPASSSCRSIFSWLDDKCCCFFIHSVCCRGSIINVCSTKSRYCGKLVPFC